MGIKKHLSRQFNGRCSFFSVRMCVYFSLALLLLIACGKPEITKDNQGTIRISESIKVGDQTRKYVAHIPEEWEQSSPIPLVFVLHGGRGSPKSIERISNFHAQKTTAEFVTVYPAAAGKFWNDGRANVSSQIDDVKFISTLVDTLGARYPIEEDSVFSTGLSNGGTMSVRLGCESRRINAVSSVASTAVKKVIDNCNPEVPTSFLIIQGTKDPITNFNGVERPKRKIVSHNYAIQKFASLNNCGSQFTEVSIPDTSGDHTSTTIKRYGDCENNSKVVSVVVKNGGHTWPGGGQYRSKFLVGNTSQDFNASEIIWQFFNDRIQ